SSQGKRLHVRLLAVLFLMIAIKLGDAMISDLFDIDQYVQFFYLRPSIFAYLAISPVFYFYIKSLLFAQFKLKWYHLIQVLPLSVLFLVKDVFLHQFCNAKCILIIQSLYSVYFVVAIFLILKSYHRLHKNIRWWFTALTIVVAVVLSAEFVADRGLLPEIAAIYSFVFYVALFYFMGRFNTINSYIEKLKLREEVDYYQHLVRVMNSYFLREKPYLRADLKQQDIARKLGYSLHDISAAVNSVVNMNFSEYVNRFRINNAKEILLNDKLITRTIEGVASDCGFNSKSTFYNAFRKQTGITPTQYRKKNLQLC
ncbi:MAG: helix-turn-helix domain-containing protein, partial [Bacteroidales bacterium]|nr:helix-turn-helix domain-containing protein [Bacteroidales bacterium]